MKRRREEVGRKEEGRGVTSTNCWSCSSSKDKIFFFNFCLSIIFKDIKKVNKGIERAHEEKNKRS